MAAGDITPYTMFVEGITAATFTSSIDVRADGVIEGLQIAAVCQGDTLAAVLALEVSFISLPQTDINDVSNVISRHWLAVDAGAATGSINEHIDFGSGLAVAAGERIYLHMIVNAAIDIGAAVAILEIADKVQRASPRRR